MRDLDDGDLFVTFFTEMAQLEQDACESLLALVEDVVAQVLLQRRLRSRSCVIRTS